MDEKKFAKIRWYFTGMVTMAMWSLLTWNYYHGGVPSHHILNRADMPEISNWWGAILLPLLTWILLYRIEKRIISHPDTKSIASGIYMGFAESLLFGILLSISFSLGLSQVSGLMFNGVLVLALLFPIYRSEYLLGFVIGMTYRFGAVLPTGIGSLLALAGAGLYLLIRPGILFVVAKFVKAVTPGKRA